jgi:membrane-associated protease RseP (regulator of RpoE activity)
MHRQHSFRPTVETLESRLTPANVSGSVVKGVLTLVADDPSAADDLDITSHATIPGAVVVTGNGATTVNTGANFIFKRVQSIVVKLKGGDDLLGVSGLRIGGSLTFQGGSSGNGNDFNVDDSSIGGTLTVSNGDNIAGADAFNLTNDVEIGRHVVVKHGTGASITVVATNVRIGGNLSVATTGTFLDLMTLTEASVGGRLTAALGAGQNDFNLIGATVHKSVLIQGGAASDTLTLTDQWIGGSLTAQLGNGLNTMNIDVVGPGGPSLVGSRIGGGLTYTGGSGLDFIVVGDEQPVVIGGPVSIATGDETLGGDSVTFEDTTFLGSVLVDLGAGNDDLDFEVLGSAANLNTSIAGKLTVFGRTGDDDVTFGVNGFPELALHLASQPALNGGGGTDTLFAGQYTIDGVAQAVLTNVLSFNVV